MLAEPLGDGRNSGTSQQITEKGSRMEHMRALLLLLRWSLPCRHKLGAAATKRRVQQRIELRYRRDVLRHALHDKLRHGNGHHRNLSRGRRYDSRRHDSRRHCRQRRTGLVGGQPDEGLGCLGW